jgi:hypothetical protein
MHIFEEILWPQFVKIERISKLPLNEQVAAYQQYVQDLSIQRQNWLNYQNKGPFSDTNKYLAQEESFDNKGITDYFAILQENGSKIIIT